MKTFIKYLERKIESCEELGGMGREKAIYQSVLKEYRKQLTIPVVSKSVNCDHPRSKRSYIGGNLLRCNKCGKEFS